MSIILDNIANYHNKRYDVFECTDEWPHTLPGDMTHLSCEDNIFTNLPDVLPDTLVKLNCAKNCLTKLPETLPDGLKYLHINKNLQLSQLPLRLPSRLLEIWCSSTAIKAIDYLPAGLTVLSCSNCEIERLPKKLPRGLKSLYCNNNKLRILPDLPDTLNLLWAHDNLLSEIPDLPCSLHVLTFNGQQDMLIKNMYPSLYVFRDNPDITHFIIADKLRYINRCNAQRRTKERMAIINTGNVLLERYMRRAMHL